MNIDRKQFIGSLFATAVLPAFALDTRSEFEKCRDDILYFVDHYLVVNDRLYGNLKMSDQQREYLKRMSETKDILVCAKGRQIGASVANNVFAYWKSIFFGSDQYVFIVEPNARMKESVKKMYGDVSNSGLFKPIPNLVHFIKPSTMMAHDLTNENNTYILDEFDFWDNHSIDGLSKQHLDRYLMNSIWGKYLCPEQFEKFKSRMFEKFKSPMIVTSSFCSYNGTFGNIMRYIDDSRRLVLPSSTRGLKA